MNLHINLKIGQDEYNAIRTEQIAYIEGHRRKCTVHRWPPYHTEPIVAAENIGEMAKSLRNFGFIQCHRNYTVSPKSLHWVSDEHIRLMHGKSIPVSPRRLRRLRTGRALPSNIIHATTAGGLCLIAPQGGPLYVSNTPLRQLLAMHRQMIQLNRWAVVNPSAITNIELQPKPMATIADGVRLNAVGRRQVACPTKTQVSIGLIINILNIIASRFTRKYLTDNTLTQQTSSPHPNFPNIRDRFQEKHEKNFSPRNP